MFIFCPLKVVDNGWVINDGFKVKGKCQRKINFISQQGFDEGSYIIEQRCKWCS